MNISEPFIRRPVATSLLMLGVVLVGLLGYRFLPVSALPTVDFPTIQVVSQYPGADPEVMASLVTAPLEKQFGQISGLSSMSSVSSFGTSVITLQFVLERKIDEAGQDVQAAINAAGGLLPQDMPNPPTFNKVNPADTPILTLAITSDNLPLEKLNDFADSILAQKLSEVTGVGLVTIQGNQKPAVRVQVNPAALAAQGLSLEDVRTAVSQANVNAPKGSFDGKQQAFTVGSNDQILKAEDFKPIILAYRNGAPVRLQDVADVEDGVENSRLAAWIATPMQSYQPAVLLDIQRQPGANIIETVERVKKILPRLTASLPAGVDLSIFSDRTETIRASVRDVQFTLVLTIGLVVLVLLMFLRRLRATIIPSVALPLSLLGTFAVMYLAGFSLDNLSLMALTISTGFVVDDAIVMIENIFRYIEKGDHPFKAALKGSKQIGFTVISLSLSLIAVFIPLLFMSGIVGRLFREFAITLSTAVAVSAFVSLTLTPMMCAKMLRRERRTAGKCSSAVLRACFRQGASLVRPVVGLGVAPPGGNPPCRGGHPCCDGRPLRARAKGPAASAGHRLAHRGYGCCAGYFVSSHAHAAAGGDGCRAQRPRRRARGGLCRRRHGQFNAQYRAALHRAQAARVPKRKRRSNHTRGCAARSVASRVSRCFSRPRRTSRSIRGRAAPSISTSSKIPMPPSLGSGDRSWSRS